MGAVQHQRRRIVTNQRPSAPFPDSRSACLERRVCFCVSSQVTWQDFFSSAQEGLNSKKPLSLTHLSLIWVYLDTPEVTASSQTGKYNNKNNMLILSVYLGDILTCSVGLYHLEENYSLLCPISADNISEKVVNNVFGVCEDCIIFFEVDYPE